MKYWWVIIPVMAIGLSGCWDFEEKGWGGWGSPTPVSSQAQPKIGGG